jgi:eukaryotic-like serine/threonine-protein kinase
MAGDRDVEHTATEPAATARRDAAAPREVAGDIESAAHDHPELPVVDPETYVYGYQFARGGMGRIVAVRDRRLGRVIAIKELLSQDPALVQRFRREIQITARLQHPAIVGVIEAGQWPTGEPFFAMKRVIGTSLKEVIEARATLYDRLGLVPNAIAIADALAYAHQHGIVHRDLKPANVLVGEFGETVVIDWGLAKDLRETGEEPLPDSVPGGGSGSVTVAGSVLGTPAFMPPEQARGGVIDERTDVYALGALLYTVLVGAPPYTGDDPAAILDQVLHGPPRRIAEVQPGVPVDLQTIVERAMARDPAARYPSARELAADLKRFQTGQLVAAHRYSRTQLIGRWIRRHRGAVLVAAAASVALAVLGTLSVARIVDERDRARAAERAAETRADALLVAQARAMLEHDPLDALRSLGELPLASTQWRAARLVAADAIARGLPLAVTAVPADVDDAVMSRDGRFVVMAGSDGQLRVLDVASQTTRTLASHGARIIDLAVSDDAQLIVGGSVDNTAAIWSATGRQLHVLRGHQGWVTGVDITPTHVITASLDRTTRIWTHDGALVSVIATHLSARQPTRDGWLLGREQDSTISVWQIADGKRALVEACPCATIAPEGGLVATAEGSTVKLRDLVRGTTRVLGDAHERVSELVFSHDAQRLAAATHGGSVVVFDTASGTSWTYRGLEGSVRGAAFSRGGGWLAAYTASGPVHLIDVASQHGRALTGTRAPVLFTTESEIVTRDRDGRYLAWATQPGGARVIDAHPRVLGIAVSPDGEAVAVGGPGWQLRLVDLRTGTHRDLWGHDAPVASAAFSPNGALVASVAGDKRVRLWEVATGRGITLPGRATRAIAFSPDGTTLAAPGVIDDVQIWSVVTGATRSFVGHTGWIADVAFSPDGRRIASGSSDGTVRIWDVATGIGHVLGRHDGGVHDVLFAADGTWIASGGEDGAVRVWSLRGERPRVLRGHDGWVLSLAVAPGGGLASSGTDRTVRVWNVAAESGTVLGQHPNSVLHVAYSPDASTLAAAGIDGTVNLWDVATGAHRGLSGHGSWVPAVAFSRGGVVTVSADGKLRVWSDDLPREPAALRGWLLRTSAR